MGGTTDAGSIEVMAVGEIEGDFYVPAYQRGYRWGEHEVRQLLTDISESGGSTYYLQPVVVSPRPDGSWELVDGQQRLTTLRLLFRYLQQEHLRSVAIRYSISYETRPKSKEYLDRLDEADSRQNIDFFHMFRAYRAIDSWFEERGHLATDQAVGIYRSLMGPVKVLWYEAPEDADENDLFRRLNVGRIPLTDAELVKALLLSQSHATASGSDRGIEIAAHWDLFERDLRVPEVWAFVTGAHRNWATNLSLVLDALAEQRNPDSPVNDPFRTFEALRHDIVADPAAFWREVVDLHSLVMGWYEDRGLFHKVGYLIAIGRTFRDLVQLSRDRGRTAFETALDAEIRGHLKLTATDLADLTYPSRRAADVLLLMNIETIRNMTDSSERYSFRAHAAGEWTLEHIHAQKAQALTKAEEWKAWLKDHRSALVDLPDVDESHRADLLGRIDATLAMDVIDVGTFTALEQEVVAVFSPDGPTADGDLIGNLALLRGDDNTALSNSVFEVKRRKVIELDKAGSYIPACTRNVFLKYYTDTADQQLHLWGEADRQDYLTAMQRVLAPYFMPEEVEA